MQSTTYGILFKNKYFFILKHKVHLYKTKKIHMSWDNIFKNQLQTN